MEEYYQKEVERVDLLESLIRLPKSNLETRIEALNTEIETRQLLRDEALTSLANLQLQLKDKLWRLRYMSVLNEGFIVNRDLMRQLMDLEERKTRETISCFKDISAMQEKRRDAKEELETEVKKLKLLESDLEK